MLRILSQPYPFSTQPGQRLRTALCIGLFVFLFLFIFKPFHLGERGTGALAAVTMCYGGICFGVLAVCFLLLPRLLPGVFREDRWTVAKEILHTLACVLAVSAGNIVFTHFYFHENFSVGMVLRFLWWTFSVSVIPIVIMVLLRQIRLMKSFSRQAAELDKELEKPTDDEEVVFLYAEAADNYVKVFYRGQPQELIRSSLKQLEEQFKGSHRIFRCHRTYLVNLDQVVHISGNAQGYKLHLEGVEQVIPVSRSLNEQIRMFVIRPRDLPGHPGGL